MRFDSTYSNKTFQCCVGIVLFLLVDNVEVEIWHCMMFVDGSVDKRMQTTNITYNGLILALEKAVEFNLHNHSLVFWKVI